MSNNETLVVIVLILAVVMVVALLKFDRRVKIMLKKLGFEIQVENDGKPPDRSLDPHERMRRPQRRRPLVFRRWGHILIGAPILLLFAAPIWWWAEQPAPWRMLLSYQFHQLISLLKHGSSKPLHTHRSQATLDSLTRTLEMRADKLNDHYRGDEVGLLIIIGSTGTPRIFRTI